MRQAIFPVDHEMAHGLLPDHIHGGVHFDLLAPQSVTFALRAPHKPYVSLVGDFNEWDSRANPLVTDGRGTWWTTIAHPGETRYGYFVAIDEQAHAWVGDPYARELRWNSDGPWAYLAPASAPFRWTDGAWITPSLRDLIIYELNVRDFGGSWRRNHPVYGTFKTVQHKIGYLAELGINAVELMPIQAFPGESSWGYNPVFYFAPAGVYGSEDDFKQLVDLCHAHGMAVILDVAFNHAWGEHPYYHYYPPMYDEKGAHLTNWNPFFHHTPQSVNMWGGLDWDHFRPDTTRYFQDVVRHWLREFHIDGFRFDWVCGVDYDAGNPMNPGFNPYHGISAVAWAAKQEKPDCILIGEYWQLEGTHPDKTAAKLVHETPLDAVWNGRFHHAVDDVLNQRWQWEQQDIFRAVGGFRDDGFATATQLVNFTCSHDEVRPEHEIKFYSGRHIARPPGMTLDEAALCKAMLGLVTLFTAPGIPMLYAGQEFGEDTPRTIDFLPLSWEKLEEPHHRRYADQVRRLIRLRHAHPALRSDHIRFYDNFFPEEKLVRYDRWTENGGRRTENGGFVAVALNFHDIAQTTTLTVPYPGVWVDALSGTRHTAQETVTLTLAPWQGAVLTPLRQSAY